MVMLRSVGRILSEARRAAGISQLDLALRRGRSQAAQSLLDRGYVTRLDAVLETARLVNADVSTILREFETALPSIRAANEQLLAEDIETALTVDEHAAEGRRSA